MAHINQNPPRPLVTKEGPLEQSRNCNVRRGTLKKIRHGISCALLLLALPSLSLAQDDGAAAGSVWGGYTVQQSIEFGGRIADVNGNHQMYDTLVNLRSGPRLLGQELSMRPMNRANTGLFDTLYLNSFGFGGDPSNMARLRIEKSKWYDFVGLYRRDENYFNFNLFANPLNLNQGIGASLRAAPGAFDPTTMPWYVNSPHLQNTTRNMGDFNLTLFPQSPIRIRLSYARNVNAGRLDTTLEAPIRTLMTEYSQSRSDRYQFGIDFRVMPRTTISLDQFFEHDKVDPNFVDNNLSFRLGSVTGTPIDIGIPFPPSGCTLVPGVTFPGNNVLTPSAKCTIGLYNFNRSGRVRTDIPTSQISLQSNYFRKLDVTASGTYSFGNSDFTNYREFVNTVKGPPSLITGTSHTDRVSGNADLGLTYHLTRTWSVSDKFRWLNWRNPGDTNQLGFLCSAIAVPGLTAESAGCTTANPANTTFISALLAERTYSNIAKLSWSSPHLMGYVGYRYGRRELTGAPVGDSAILNSYYSVTDGVEDAPRSTARINEHTALAGVAVRPVPAWRINADIELMSADNFFTTISPRHQQRARINTNYKVNRWSSINAGVHFIETRNNFDETINATVNPTNPNLFPTTGANTVPGAYGHKDHWRYYTFGASLNPDRHFGIDFGWTYLDQLINSATCVPSTGLTVQSTPALCNGFNTPPISALPLIQDYQERTNSGFAHLTIRPVHRVTVTVGYELTSTAGHNRWLLPGGSDGTGNLVMVSDIYGNSPPLVGNPIAPCPVSSTVVTGGCGFAGPFPDAPLSQALNWHKPNAGIAIDVVKNVSLRGNYAFFDYNEKELRGLPLVTLPRNFRANTGTVSLKYAF